MVKNTTGGNKAKGQARKLMGQQAHNNNLRLAKEEDELYAKVTVPLGNGMCQVLCIDGKKRLCHIRGKFKGRGKKDNFITRDSWVLIGIREWESDEAKVVKGKEKLPNCDLLEVYRDHDKEIIKNSAKLDWSIFIETADNKNTSTDQAEEDFDFVNNDTVAEYKSLMESNIEEKGGNTIIIDDEEIDVDDI